MSKLKKALDEGLRRARQERPTLFRTGTWYTDLIENAYDELADLRMAEMRLGVIAEMVDSMEVDLDREPRDREERVLMVAYGVVKEIAKGQLAGTNGGEEDASKL
jgi:hypothetical protein